jgi:hypothetical protein
MGAILPRPSREEAARRGPFPEGATNFLNIAEMTYCTAVGYDCAPPCMKNVGTNADVAGQKAAPRDLNQLGDGFRGSLATARTKVRAPGRRCKRLARLFRDKS